MRKLFLLIVLSVILNSGNALTKNQPENEPGKSKITASQNDVSDGIIYFSFDNGNYWVNTSKGLPNNVSIGLGGISVSNQIPGIATKENGIYLYNFGKRLWESVPTEKKIIEANIGALALVENAIYVGTQNKGIFCTKDSGRTWENLSAGLKNTTIRRFCELNRKLYVCTNDGFYALNINSNYWKQEFGMSGLQVNGATLFNGSFYLATNKGIYKGQTNKTWINIAPHLSLHNICSDNDQIYAMSYNELLSSKDGETWQNRQNGLPKNLYTFNVLNYNNIVFAGQWDGIYRKTNDSDKWEFSGKGLPSNFAVTNLKAINNILVISTSERKLKEGIIIEK